MQPIGNIYELANSSQVGNIPMGAGVSVGLCIPEGTMYLKSMQNNGPVTLGYKLVPIENQVQHTQPMQSAQPAQQNNNAVLVQRIEELFKKFDARLGAVEQKLSQDKKEEKGGKSGWEI